MEMFPYRQALRRGLDEAVCDPRAEEVCADDNDGHPQVEEEADVDPGQHGRLPRDAAQQELEGSTIPAHQKSLQTI